MRGVETSTALHLFQITLVRDKRNLWIWSNSLPTAAPSPPSHTLTRLPASTPHAAFARAGAIKLRADAPSPPSLHLACCLRARPLPQLLLSTPRARRLAFIPHLLVLPSQAATAWPPSLNPACCLRARPLHQLLLSTPADPLARRPVPPPRAAFARGHSPTLLSHLLALRWGAAAASPSLSSPPHSVLTS